MESIYYTNTLYPKQKSVILKKKKKKSYKLARELLKHRNQIFLHRDTKRRKSEGTSVTTRQSVLKGRNIRGI